MPADPALVESIFTVAAALSDPAARAAYLDTVCKDDTVLRARVERLLAAHDRAVETIAQPSAPTDRTPLPAPLTAGTVLSGRYTLLRALGAGGMGQVFLAEQSVPVRRSVAVKVIRDDLDTARVLARFEQERQALAVMDHPNIAKVLDAGTEADRPYFVMELVRGVPLSEYCDTNQLPVRERLELFRQVCEAVQHAHQKGVIHRDLKPTNVLVEEVDGKPVPKVIDFGLAKATGDARLSGQTDFTGFGTILGTPLYMAPEQATFGAQDVDTRADIYALGAILYELLTGTTPVDREMADKLPFEQLLQAIREQDPPVPSARLAESADRAVAAARGTDPTRLARSVRRDLDWVVMKALAKYRNRRYESAAALEQDIARFLANEPVTAGPPGSWYRVQKFVRRHRGRVAAVAVVFLSLVAGIIGTSLGLAKANRMAEDANIARNAEAERARGEEIAKVEADKRADQFRRMSNILAAIFAEIDPQAAEKQGRPLRDLLGERLLAAAEQLNAESARDPIAVAVLQSRLGMSLVNLGFQDRAIPLHEKAVAALSAALGPDDRATLGAQNSLAEAYSAARRPADAIRLHEALHARFRDQLGADHHDTLVSQNNLALAYSRAGREADAIRLHEDTLRRRRAANDPDIANSLNNLATVHLAHGRHAVAIPLLEESLELLDARYGRDHHTTLGTMSNLGLAYLKVGRHQQAIPLQEETLSRQRTNLGQDHPETLISMNHLGEAYRADGRTKEAFPLLEECLRRSITRLGTADPETTTRRGNLARAYIEAGLGADAVPHFAAFISVRRQQLGAGTPSFAWLLARISSDLLDAGQPVAAETYLRESLAIREKVEPDLWTTFDVRSMLGAALLAQGKRAEAGPLLEAGYLGLKARAAAIPPTMRRQSLARALDSLVRHAEETGASEAATKWRKEQAALPPEIAPPPRPVPPPNKQK